MQGSIAGSGAQRQNCGLLVAMLAVLPKKLTACSEDPGMTSPGVSALPLKQREVGAELGLSTRAATRDPSDAMTDSKSQQQLNCRGRANSRRGTQPTRELQELRYVHKPAYNPPWQTGWYLQLWGETRHRLGLQQY